MFVFLLTATTLYDIMREYRRMNRLCSFAVPGERKALQGFQRETRCTRAA